MSEILLMKMVNRDGPGEITAHESSQDLAEHLYRRCPDDISWIIKLEGTLMRPPNIRSLLIPEIAMEVAAFGRGEESKK